MTIDKEFLVQLTGNLYRLTLLFPKKEPLRYKMRELASDILDKCLRINFNSEPDKNFSEKEEPGESGSPRAFNDLEVLDGFFEVALIQNWASPSEVLAIKEKYDSLKGEVKRLSAQEKEAAAKVRASAGFENSLEFQGEKNAFKNQGLLSGINQRQKKILSFLKQNNRAQVWQIKKIMPDVTKRTLRRDFEQMLRQKIIERKGEKNDTFYQIKNIES